MIRAKMP